MWGSGALWNEGLQARFTRNVVKQQLQSGDRKSADGISSQHFVKQEAQVVAWREPPVGDVGGAATRAIA